MFAAATCNSEPPSWQCGCWDESPHRAGVDPCRTVLAKSGSVPVRDVQPSWACAIGEPTPGLRSRAAGPWPLTACTASGNSRQVGCPAVRVSTEGAVGDQTTGGKHFFGERAVGLPQTLLKLTQLLTYLASEDRAWEPWGVTFLREHRAKPENGGGEVGAWFPLSPITSAAMPALGSGLHTFKNSLHVAQ